MSSSVGCWKELSTQEPAGLGSNPWQSASLPCDLGRGTHPAPALGVPVWIMWMVTGPTREGTVGGGNVVRASAVAGVLLCLLGELCDLDKVPSLSKPQFLLWTMRM